MTPIDQSQRLGRRQVTKQWEETAAAAAALGLTPRQLRKLRTQILKPKEHYRLKNPISARREYLWNIATIAPLLTPNDD
ncbi:hypothetical protein [Phormidesmis priestleyi]